MNAARDQTSPNSSGPTLEAALASAGTQRFHARQIFRWVYRRGVTDLAAMTDLPRELRDALPANSR